MQGQTQSAIRDHRPPSALRGNLADAEQRLWFHLRRRQLDGFKFRRQHPFGSYILDFVCLEARLVIELDGGQHAERIHSNRDRARDALLRAAGFTVLRFWNNEVFEQLDAVLDVIRRCLVVRQVIPSASPPSPPPFQGGHDPLPPLQGDGWGGDRVKQELDSTHKCITNQPHPPPDLPLEGGGTLRSGEGQYTPLPPLQGKHKPLPPLQGEGWGGDGVKQREDGVHQNNQSNLEVGGTRCASHHRGAALTEFLLVAGLALGPLALGTWQVALIHNAKQIVNYATFEAARNGAVHHGEKAKMQDAFVRTVLPLYGGGTDSTSLVAARTKAVADLNTPAAPGQKIGAGFSIAILNPTVEAFNDFGENVKVNNKTLKEIPNDHLRFRDRTIGKTSAVNIQDANLLKIEVTYGYKMVVPLINRLTAAALKKLDPANSTYYSADPPRLPIKSVALVRMHTPARLDGNLTVAAIEAGEPGAAGAVPPPPGSPPGNEPPEEPPPENDPGQGGGDPILCLSGSCPVCVGDRCCNSGDPNAPQQSPLPNPAPNPFNLGSNRNLPPAGNMTALQGG